MNALLTTLAVAVLFAATPFVDQAEAKDKHKNRRARVEVRAERAIPTYWGPRDIRIVRDYYRPDIRALPPGLQRRYVRTGTLPPGWARRVRPFPRAIERTLAPLPRIYRRGILDGRAIVYGPGGFVIDVAVLF